MNDTGRDYKFKMISTKIYKADDTKKKNIIMQGVLSELIMTNKYSMDNFE